jgi:PAS domain S-box-containing protein
MIYILHLEDDPVDAELIQVTLTSAGLVFKIDWVQTGDEFSQALRRGGYNLILADYRLPSYDGMSALLLEQEWRPDVPFIFVSGTLGEDAAIEGLTKGAIDYVPKTKLSRLVPAVKRALSETENQKKRKQAEDALKESEERYRTLIEQASDGIFLADPQRNFVDVNPSGCNMLGYTREEMLKLNMKDLTDARDKSISPLRFDELYSGQVILLEKKLITKSGALLPVEISGKVLDNGNMQGIVRDITERKQHEREREAIITVSAALRQATTRTEILNIILDQLVDMFDSDGAMLVLPNLQTGGFIDEMGRGAVAERMIGLNIPPGKGVCSWVVTNKNPT